MTTKHILILRRSDDAIDSPCGCRFNRAVGFGSLQGAAVARPPRNNKEDKMNDRNNKIALLLLAGWAVAVAAVMGISYLGAIL